MFLDALENTLRTVNCCYWANHILPYAQINWAARLPQKSQNQICFSSCLPAICIPFKLLWVCTAKTERVGLFRKRFLMLIFWKVSHHNDRENIRLFFFGLESVGKISTIYTAAIIQEVWGLLSMQRRCRNLEIPMLLAERGETKAHLLLHGLSIWIFFKFLQHKQWQVLLCHCFGF